MKTIIGLIVFTLIFSIGAIKAQSLNEIIQGTWIVTGDTTYQKYKTRNDNILAGKSEPKNQDNMPNAVPAQKIILDSKKTPTENDIWKFTKDSLYYTPNSTKGGSTSKCAYTIKDSVIYCYGQPAYNIIKLTETDFVIKSDESGSGTAGIFIIPNPATILYLKRNK